MTHVTYAKTLPADLSAPAFVSVWRSRALVVGAVFGVIGLILAFLAGDHFQHLLRSWLLGLMITLGFSIGGMALLMVQYLSGGKWGLLIRRPLGTLRHGVRSREPVPLPRGQTAPQRRHRDMLLHFVGGLGGEARVGQRFDTRLKLP